MPSMHHLNTDTFVIEGLRRLKEEAFGPNGFARGMDEVVDVVVYRASSTYGRGYMLAQGSRVQRGLDET